MKWSTLQRYLFLALCALLFTSVWSYQAFLKIERENARILNEAIPISTEAAELFPALLNLELVVRSYILSPNEADLAQYDRTIDRLDQTVKRLNQLDENHPIMRKLVRTEAIPRIETATRFYDAQLALVRSGDQAVAEAKRYQGMQYIETFRPIDARLRADVNRIIAEATNRSEQASSAAKWVIVVVASIAVIVLIAFIQTFRMERSKQALIHRSLHDALTGIPNRRAFDERLEQLLEEAKQHQTPLSLILIDVDAFKSYNDTYGHLKGDECLKEVARVLKRQARHGQVARYGGEEFTVLLPRGAEETRRIAERIRQDILDLNIVHERYEPLCRVSVSLGLTSLVPGAETTEKEVIDQADQALYRAKENGRNQIGDMAG
ncbi:diguanylate cyclase [Exiguobacterium sp. KKBO11]|uniref:GGDEF domain-containing protein n=1 Tax=Exiguobacterium sp. KKBO11 TaxID=1805000 RepID=UPI0007D83387|nr:diguanylate cyclase [Exiguobacterium sp. KKBO11]OAI82736.1 diguanylate cyclase [Exiguobacterium sp. KKBO11]